MNPILVSFGGASIDAAIVERVGWTLVHFLWQGSMVAAALALADLALARARPTHRYVAGCAAMVLMLALPLATFATLGARSGAVAAPPPAVPAPDVVIDAGSGFAAAATPAAPGTPRRSPFVSMVESIRVHALLPWLVAFWAAGVGLLSVRLLGGWWLVARIACSARNVPLEAWQGVVQRIARPMGIDRTVRVVRSSLVSVPTAIGWLRPVILVPASTLTGLNSAQIEAILAHELAHVRRHDYLVNLVQSAVEILLFYHPAVWWVSRRVRDERELCCDDLAVRVSGDPVSYAKALCELERRRGAAAPMALAATGGSLLSRIARLVGAAPPTHVEASRGLACALLLALVAIGGAARSAVQVNIDVPAATARVVAAAPATLAVIATRIVAPVAPTPAVAPIETALVSETVLAAGVGAAEIGCETPRPPEAPVPAAPEAPEDVANMADGTDLFGHSPSPSPTPPSGSVARRFTPGEWERLSQHGVSPTYVANLAKVGYPNLSFGQLVKLAQHGVMSAYAGKMREALGDPSVDDLVRLAGQGVSSRYAGAMTTAFGDLSVDDLVRLASQGISSAYVAGMRRLDVDDLTVDEVVRLANAGVTLEWFSALRWMGYDDLTVERAIELRNAGVTPAYAASLRILNRHEISLDDLRTLRNQGVEVDYAAAMLGMVRRDLEVTDLIRLRNQGVTVQLVAALNALGYPALSTDELVQLRQQGVEPEFIASMRAAGYRELDVEQLVRLRQNGVDGDFVEQVRRAGLGQPDVEDLLRMRQRGIPRTNPLP